MVMFLSACIEGILWLFTNFYLQRKFSIFLRNNHDYKVVDPYNARKRYTVIKSLDLMRNIPWLASCFCKIKKPNKKFYFKTAKKEIIVWLLVFAIWHNFTFSSLSNILIWSSTCGSVRYMRKIQNRKIQSKRVLGLTK
jgi:hypothetical protein